MKPICLGKLARHPKCPCRALTGPVLLAAALLLAPGCTSSFEAIDLRTQILLDHTSEAVGGDSPAPQRTFDDPKADPQPDWSSKQPGTANADAAELTFDPADEARDVTTRLENYATSAALGDGREILEIDLAEAFQISQRSGRDFLNAEEEYILAAIRVLVERHRWSPRLFNDLSVNLAGSGDDGNFQSAVNVINDLRITKQLPFGGRVEASWIWRATEQLREQAAGRYRQSSELAVSTNIPLLRGFGEVARESLIQQERNLIYAARGFERFRRQYLVTIANDYFRLLQAQAQIANQKRQLTSLRELQRAEEAREGAGRRSVFQLAITENRVLSAELSLQNQRDSYITQLDRFKVSLGLSVDQPIRIENIAFDLAEPNVVLQDATESALTYRLDLQNRRDQLVDRRRGVRNARDDMRPDLNFNARVGLPTDPSAREGGIAFDPDELTYSTGITFGLPLDREIERLNLRQAIINLEQSGRSFDEFRDNLALDVRRNARGIDLARNRLNLSNRQVQINEQRLKEQIIKADEIDPQSRVDTENDLLNALNDRDRAQTDLRIAVLNYLLSTGQMRVDRGGQFQPLPGLEVSPIELFSNVPDLDTWYTGPEEAEDQ